MNQGMFDGLLGELRNISRQLEKLVATLDSDGPTHQALGVPVAEQGRGTVAAAETVKAEPKKFKKAKGGG